MMNSSYKACVRMHSGEVYTGMISLLSDEDHVGLTTETETVFLPRKDIKSIEDLDSNVIFLGDRAPI